MFERHFGLRENPFVAGHQHRFVYPSPEHLEALAHLRYGIENREPFVLITGEVGTGKTTALYDALSEWESRVVVALITNSALTRAELLEEIALRFGVVVAPNSSKPQIMTALERHLLAVRARQHRAILLLDEAQNLERELLEEIRLLSNLENAGDNLLQVVLVGQPELEEKLSRPELRQLRQRITVHYRLSPLSAEDTERYIQHRVSVAGGHALSVFPTDACHAIHRLTSGIPREINHLAAQSMLAAYVEDAPSVRVAHVESAAHEIEFKSVSPVAKRPEAPARTAAAPPPPSVPAPAPAPAPPAREPEPAPARESAAATAPAPAEPAKPAAPEGPPRTASSAAWDTWMSAIANSPEGAARASEPAAPADATSSDPPAPDAYVPPSFEPAPATPAPEPRHERPVPTHLPPPITAPAHPEPLTLDRSHVEPEPEFAARLQHAMEQPAPEPPTIAPADHLPARLREKLEQAEYDESGDRGSRLVPWLVGVGVAAALAVSALLWMRFRDTRANATPVPQPAPIAAPVDSAVADTSALAVRDSLARASVAESTRVTPATPRPTASAPAPVSTPATPAAATPSAPAPVRPAPAASAAPAAATPAPPPMRYGVVVKSLLLRERADAERERLAAAAGLPARVLVVRESGGDAFRVVLGEWTDRAAAERGASDLIRRGLVDEARVVSIGRAPAPARP